MKRHSLQIITALFILTTILVPLSAAAQQPPANTSSGPSSTANAGGQALSTVGVILGAAVAPLIKIIDGIIELAILPIAGFIFWITGQMLDQTIPYSLGIYDVINGTGGASTAIILGWTIIRDIFNMMFIFVIIWVAIATMLDISKWSAKQMLTKIIIAAVLINFSFFITEVIIDAGNLFGAWFYNGIITTLGSASNAFHSGATLSASNVSLSAGLSTALGVYSLYTPTSSVWGTFSIADSTQSLIGAIIRLGVVAFSSYIFAYVSVLFIARTVSLLFSLVTSPIGFAGGILPQTADYAKKWWKELLDNVLLAPIFLLFLYIIIAFTATPIFANSNLIGNAPTSGFSIAQYFKYFLLAFMILYALRAAKEHAGQLGDTVGKMASQLGQFAVGAVTGGAGLVGQLTIGAAASRLAGNQTLNQTVAAGGIKGAVAGFAQKRISGVADYHFNPAGSVLGKETGYKTGKGYDSMMKGRGEQQKKAMEALAVTPKDTAPAKDALERAESAAYYSYKDKAGDDKLGKAYERGYKAMQDAEKDYKADPNKENNKKYIDAQNYVNNVKSLIEKDPTFDKNKAILENQEKQLENIKVLLGEAKSHGTKDDANKYQKQVDAMNKAMGQGRSIEAAKTGLGISTARVFSGKTAEESTSKLGKTISKAFETAGKIITLGATKAASNQYLKDNEKIVKGMKEVPDKGKKKDKEKDMAKFFATLAEEAETGGGATPPPPPPSGGGTPAAGGTGTTD